jgi:GntR family transcriptional regulator of arabinose operon
MATKHQEVLKYIERLIADGTISTGEILPGELELSRVLSVSRNTIRHALGALSQKYRIERTPGRGTIYYGEISDNNGTETIGVINSSLMYNIYPELIQGIEDGLYRGGYNLQLVNGNYDPVKEYEATKRMLAQGIEGLIVEPMNSANMTPDNEYFDLLNKAGVPVMTTNCIIPGLKASHISIDDMWIGRRAVEYLLENGHRRIGCIYKSDNQAGLLRFSGYRKALEDAGIGLNPDYIRDYIQEQEASTHGAVLTGEILDNSKQPPTAIFYFNDQIALQAYNSLNESGLSIPDDLSVVAVDNIPEATYVSPGLTTFNHPKYLMGKLAAEMILARIGPHNDDINYGVVMTPELVVRGSVISI